MPGKDVFQILARFIIIYNVFWALPVKKSLPIFMEF